jgi:hypothetical protein
MCLFEEVPVRTRPGSLATHEALCPLVPVHDARTDLAQTTVRVQLLTTAHSSDDLCWLIQYNISDLRCVFEECSVSD